MKVSQGSKVKSLFSLLRHPLLSIHFRGGRQFEKEYHQLIVLGKILKPYFFRYASIRNLWQKNPGAAYHSV